MFFFTSDEHMYHPNIISFCGRPFASMPIMNEEIIKRHNEVVGQNDSVIHAGDYTLRPTYKEAMKCIERLNGKHIFLMGSHDVWLKGTHHHEIWEGMIEDQYIVVCHYAMKVWPRSHYGSWQLFGHSHNKLQPEGKQMDVGVDCHNFYPVSFTKIKEYMKTRPDNFNQLKDKT